MKILRIDLSENPYGELVSISFELEAGLFLSTNITDQHFKWKEVVETAKNFINGAISNEMATDLLYNLSAVPSDFTTEEADERDMSDYLSEGEWIGDHSYQPSMFDEEPYDEFYMDNVDWDTSYVPFEDDSPEDFYYDEPTDYGYEEFTVEVEGLGTTTIKIPLNDVEEEIMRNGY